MLLLFVFKFKSQWNKKHEVTSSPSVLAELYLLLVEGGRYLVECVHIFSLFRKNRGNREDAITATKSHIQHFKRSQFVQCLRENSHLSKIPPSSTTPVCLLLISEEQREEHSINIKESGERSNVFFLYLHKGKGNSQLRLCTR